MKSKKPKIFTIGGATFDIFVQAEDQSIITFQTPTTKQKWLAFPHASKVRIKEVLETFGGGATNTAITFAGMGFETYFVGMIGKEYGERVIDNLRAKKVACDYVLQTDKDRTGFSNIINTFDGDRNLLYYAGANRFFTARDLPMEALKQADWIFLSHLAEKNSKIPSKLQALLKQCPRIKLAWNPGREQIEQGMKAWKELLRHTEVLFLNKEEAAAFTGMAYQLAGNKQDDPKQHESSKANFLPPYADDVTGIIKALLKTGVKKVVITDGRNGAQASDGKHNYFCPVVTHRRVDTLGAGDAYASGVTSALMKGFSLKTGLFYGTINAGSVVNLPGAQNGLLTGPEMEKAMKKNKIEVKIR